MLALARMQRYVNFILVDKPKEMGDTGSRMFVYKSKLFFFRRCKSPVAMNKKYLHFV